MNPKARELLIILVLLATGLYFSIVGLIAAQPFLGPLSVAVLLAMVLVAPAQRIEKWGISRGWSSFLCVLLTLGFFIGLAFVVSSQVKMIAEDWPKIKEQTKPKLERLQHYISEKTGIAPAEQKQIIKEKVGAGGEDSGESSESEKDGKKNESGGNAPGARAGEPASDSGGGPMSSIGDVLFAFFSFTGTALLTCIYIFFLLLYRRKLKKSILRFVSEDTRDMADHLLRDSVRISTSYLSGRLLLIFILIVFYAIGMTISGVKHAILISILAAVLSLVPYIGNIIGYVLAMAMALFSGGSTGALIGVTVTFGIAQFVESYILEPYIVGHKVELNPLMTILVVVLGGAVWGVVGMIISIPVFGIIKITCDQIRILRPIGYMLGEEDIEAHEKENIVEKKVRKIKKG